MGRRQWRLVGGVWCVRGRKCAWCRRTAGSGEGRALLCGQGLVSVVLLRAVASAMSRGALCSYWLLGTWSRDF